MNTINNIHRKKEIFINLMNKKKKKKHKSAIDHLIK